MQYKKEFPDLSEELFFMLQFIGRQEMSEEIRQDFRADLLDSQ